MCYLTEKKLLEQRIDNCVMHILWKGSIFELVNKNCIWDKNKRVLWSGKYCHHCVRIISRNNTIQTAIHHVVSIYYVFTPGKPSVIEIIPSFSLAYFLPKNYLTFQYLFICWSFFNFGSYQCCILVVSL
jgi:hypothetical protein